MQFRKAQKQSKLNAQERWNSEREKLFGSFVPSDSASKKLSSEDQMVNKSEDITNTLRRVHQMAQTEVIKSSINMEELEYSTKSLRELQGKYNAFDVMLNGSHRLIRHLEEADKWDRFYMIASLSFLAAVLFWIIWRRILKAPTMLLLWTLTKGFNLAAYIGGGMKSNEVLSGVESSPLLKITTVMDVSSLTDSGVMTAEFTSLETPVEYDNILSTTSIAMTTFSTSYEAISSASDAVEAAASSNDGSNTISNIVHSDL